VFFARSFSRGTLPKHHESKHFCHPTYALPVERVRLDATTSCGHHTVTDDGLMQFGHSKDHRVRCSIHPLIPFAERSPLGQRGWVNRLTHDRKVRGTKARRRSGEGEKLVKPSPARPAWYGQG
jgi:hypothetical protein